MEKLSILAKLELTEEEAEIAKQDLEQMLAFVDVLKELDTDEICDDWMGEEAFMGRNVFREDVIVQQNNREDILKNAPARQEDCFVVPCTIGGREG